VKAKLTDEATRLLRLRKSYGSSELENQTYKKAVEQSSRDRQAKNLGS